MPIISRRRGSAIAGKTSVVVAALAMQRTVYSYVGILQDAKPKFSFLKTLISIELLPKTRKIERFHLLEICYRITE
jgi:hypothetical protein